jgi:hypothetical protein
MTATAKFMQICASHNDLFGLDEKGDVYQYNFSMKAWVKLAPDRREDVSATAAPAARAPHRELVEDGHGR